MNLILKELEDSEKFQEYIQKLKIKESPIILSGLSDVGMAQMISASKEYQEKSILVLTYNELQAKKLWKDISFFTDSAIFFPKREILTYDYIAESKELPYERIEALIKIYQKRAKVIITTVEAATQCMIAKAVLFQNVLKLKVGDTFSIEELKQKLTWLGYEKQELIEQKGQYSNRGGIVDIAMKNDIGVRIEFWGDEIDSIRYFSISTQRSTDMIEKIDIYPMHEYLLEYDLEQVCRKIEEKACSEKQIKNKQEDIEVIKQGDYFSKIDKYFDCFYSRKSNLIEYLSKEYLIVYDEIGKINARAENIKQENENLQKTLIEKDRMIPEAIQENFSWEDIKDSLEKNSLVYMEKNDFGLKLQASKYQFSYREINFYKSNIEDFFQLLENRQGKIYIVVDSKEKAKKLQEILTQKEIVYEYKEKLQDTEIKSRVRIQITIGTLSSGFELYDLNLIVISASELIEAEKKKRRRLSQSFKEGERVVFADLKIGDYIVHKLHGIGQFVGVHTIKADGVTKDYIKIRYKNEDYLYIPTDQLDSIRKYIGGGEGDPKLNRLGSKEWSNTKAKVKNNLREVARDLMELYAKRQKIRGFAFAKDTVWQTEFENSFPYEETEDQLRCIEEVKKDMEMPKPMDRLLCGDVGYGKTEVAIRAAFKAVMDQKQVAYLVPTTVLADQQYQSFKERMEQFPIRVDVLNRFRTKKEQEQIIRKLKLGEIDVIIGTHRLLSQDVEFKDLGFLIIDEEHRFGVKAKEKIKEYKTNIDVLTMTATPIPRTLHMSIVGVRDMSVIYEPPQNRKPVQTYVLEYDIEVVKEAIIRELERNGQVFYLFNQVEGIERKAQQIAELVPEAKVGYAHGKMTGNELENIMMDFIKGDINVLICTTILESGIDIPNANTIIVENADRLGLAQLYQIRGRVGRSNQQAYAYITYKRDKLLTEVADKRLKAMKEFTEFGSGFKIAMRDLEIRGAGSLLRRNSTWTYGTSWI